MTFTLVYVRGNPVTSIPTNKTSQSGSIHQSVSSIHESQSDSNNYDVFLDLSDSSESDEEEDETESCHSISSTSITESARLPLRESLGISGCFIIIGGTLGSIVSLSFLIFLWAAHSPSFGAEDSPIIVCTMNIYFRLYLVYIRGKSLTDNVLVA